MTIEVSAPLTVPATATMSVWDKTRVKRHHAYLHADLNPLPQNAERRRNNLRRIKTAELEAVATCRAPP